MAYRQFFLAQSMLLIPRTIHMRFYCYFLHYDIATSQMTGCLEIAHEVLTRLYTLHITMTGDGRDGTSRLWTVDMS